MFIQKLIFLSLIVYLDNYSISIYQHNQFAKETDTLKVLNHFEMIFPSVTYQVNIFNIQFSSFLLYGLISSAAHVKHIGLYKWIIDWKTEFSFPLADYKLDSITLTEWTGLGIFYAIYLNLMICF